MHATHVPSRPACHSHVHLSHGASSGRQIPCSSGSAVNHTRLSHHAHWPNRHCCTAARDGVAIQPARADALSDEAKRLAAERRAAALAISAGPTDEPPSYEAIDSRPHNRLFMHLFRQAVVEGLGEDAPEPGFDGIITLTRRLSNRFADPRDTQILVRGILRSLFPQWLLPAFRVMFARPFPGFSNWLNANVTALSCQWLMGPSAVTAVEFEDGRRVEGAGVKVERCRVLEQSGCASVCVNCCKIPTQEFFEKDMGIDLRMTPNYEDFSCQFDFGRKPLPPAQDEALNSPCFKQCPSKKERLVKRQCGGLDDGQLLN